MEHLSILEENELLRNRGFQPPETDCVLDSWERALLYDVLVKEDLLRPLPRKEKLSLREYFYSRKYPEFFLLIIRRQYSYIRDPQNGLPPILQSVLRPPVDVIQEEFGDDFGKREPKSLNPSFTGLANLSGEEKVVLLRIWESLVTGEVKAGPENAASFNCYLGNDGQGWDPFREAIKRKYSNSLTAATATSPKRLRGGDGGVLQDAVSTADAAAQGSAPPIPRRSGIRNAVRTGHPPSRIPGVVRLTAYNSAMARTKRMGVLGSKEPLGPIARKRKGRGEPAPLRCGDRKSKKWVTKHY